MKIVNKSDIPVKFNWKAFRKLEDEAYERDRLNTELSRMERMERERVDDIIAAEGLSVPEVDDEGALFCCRYPTSIFVLTSFPPTPPSHKQEQGKMTTKTQASGQSKQP